MSRRRSNRVLSHGATRSTTPTRTVGTNPGMRVETVVSMRPSHQRRPKAGKMTGAQRNSEGRRSEWAMTPYIFTDPKWGATCSTV